MTIEELLEKYKRKYPGVPYEISRYYKAIIVSKKNGSLHSYNDAPALVSLGGKETWGKNGKLHRENDKPASVHPDGKKFYYYNGEFHRENDKPAIIFPNGKKYYFYHGKEYTPTQIQKKQINKLTAKKTSKQKQREDLLKEFVSEVLNT